MSRYNVPSNQSSARKISGDDTPEGKALYAAVQPMIDSWVEQCRAAAELSKLPFVMKHLTGILFSADWLKIGSNETLRIDLHAPPGVTAKQIEEIAEEVKHPIPEIPEPPGTEEPETPKPPTIEEIQIKNELPEVLPPQLIKCLVILFNNTDYVVYDMRSIERGLATQTPLFGPKTTQGDWTLPPHTEVTRLFDYYGDSPYGDSHARRGDYVAPYTLQMTNNKDMGPIAVASVSFNDGVFSDAGTHQLYKLSGGFKLNAPLEAHTQPGHVGMMPGFPALNTDGTTIFACTQTFEVVDGVLSQTGSDVYGHNSLLADTYSVPPIPLSPRFIGNDGQGYFDLGYPFLINQPSFGDQALVPSSSASDFNNAFTIGGPDAFVSSGSTWVPILTQADGIDVLTATEVTTGSELVDIGDGVSITQYHYGSLNSWGAMPFIMNAPYPSNPDNVTWYGFFNDDDNVGTLTCFLGGVTDSDWETDTGLNADGAGVFTGFMQVSNGTHNLQGFAVHSKTFDVTNHIWPLETYYFFMDGVDYTSTLESATGTGASSIQYIFMDVPYFSAQTIKVAPPP